MKEKIAGILGCTYVKMTGSCSDCEYNKTNFCQRWSTIDALEALIEQEQQPLVEALRISRDYIIDAIAHETKPRIAWAMKEDLAKIDTVLKGPYGEI